jgi:AcrR family transcriptional regulator
MKTDADELLSDELVDALPAPPGAEPRRRRATARLPQAQRRAQILEKASEYFAEHGLGAQTRALADACGVSQRLLYTIFPSKAALLDAVYEAEIAGPMKSVWFVRLQDRGVPLERRLTEFYCEYWDAILTRRWLRLFLHASLAEASVAPVFIADMLSRLLQIIVREAAFEQRLCAPGTLDQTHEVAWILHGAVSHLAIRRHIYGNRSSVEAQQVIALHVKSFLGGLGAVLPPL